ncbi:MAG: pilus assembly protein [Deltaproteobacteria bacterium]|nr:pilus assembly protein [Deltaproteobacteria bacterium]TLN02312.1 MAG: pilus assembly protein [bacterium]
MKRSKYLQAVSNVFAQNRLLKFAMLCLGFASIASTLGSLKALNSQKIVLVPPNVNSQMWVSGNKASDEYLKEFARYIAALAFSYHPGTVRKQFSELLAMYTPGEFENAQKVFYSLANKIEEARVASTFYVNEISNWENRTIEVKGYKTTFFPDKTSEEIQTSYFIAYVINDGKFQITSIMDKEAETKKEALNAKK